MPVVRSAGVLLFRTGPTGSDVEVLLGHPGGPFFRKKDDGAWSILKGLYEVDEDPHDAAFREFAEEAGSPVPDGRELALGEARLPTGKWLTVFAVEGDLDPTGTRSNTFEMEWPPRSGALHIFPEIDRVAWFTPAEAERKLARGQFEFVSRLLSSL